MARKVARLERAGALTPRDRIWAAIRQMQAGDLLWSAIEVQFLANVGVAPEHQVHVDTVLTYLKDMSQASPPYVSRVQRDVVGRRRSELMLWNLLRDVGVDAPRVTTGGKPVTIGAGYEALWTAMKVLSEFDVEELVRAACAGDTKVSVATAQNYCTGLARAGYLVLITQGVPNVTRSRYRFVRARNTGPRAPLFSKDRHAVVDGNTGVEHATPPREKECKVKT